MNQQQLSKQQPVKHGKIFEDATCLFDNKKWLKQ